METSEQIKIAEQLLKFTQDYISVKKLLKTVKTNEAKSDLEKLSKALETDIKNSAEEL